MNSLYNNYKVCILAAGVGNIGAVSENVNRAILPVDFKAVISHIIEKFPKEIELVVAIGHQKETIVDYLSLAHPERAITYVEVENYIGPGSGPGYSLLQCKDHLQLPFIYFAADTLVLEDIPPPTENWFGIAPVSPEETERYCTVKIKNNLICQLDDKIKTDNKTAFIGLAGVKDYEIFFDGLEKDTEIVKGEIQTSNGFKKLIERRLVPIKFTWFDTGTFEKYIEANKHFVGEGKKFDFSKGNEFLYFVNGRVIKYFADTEIARKRCERAKYLKGLCPEIEGSRGGFYSYRKLDGHTLYHMLNSEIFRDFLHWSRDVLWKKPELSEEDKRKFLEACRKFYYDKTMKRLEEFYSKYNITDSENNINGVLVPSLKDLFDKLDFDYVCNGIPVRFHGDFTIGNIFVTRDKESQLHKDFGGLTKVGDIYYDLAKLYKGIILSDELIKEGMFSFDKSGSSIYYDYFIKNQLLEAKEEYEKFIRENGFDLQKVRIIAALTLLNMSPLHHEPFSFLVYYLGKNLLYKTLTELEENKNARI